MNVIHAKKSTRLKSWAQFIGRDIVRERAELKTKIKMVTSITHAAYSSILQKISYIFFISITLQKNEMGCHVFNSSVAAHLTAASKFSLS